MFGPVSGGDKSPWYPMIFGVGGAIYVWIRYTIAERSRKPGPLVMAWATLVCCFMIFVGIWLLLHR